MSVLEKILNKSGCDKAKKHKYHTVYEPDFELLRYQEINILEVGVFHGHSVQAWLEYFPNAKIYGLDVFTRVDASQINVLNQDRVQWLKADSTAYGTADKIRKKWGQIEFDIIIDDGLHTPEANAKTLNNLWEFLKPGGSYYVEDAWPLDIMTVNEMQHDWIVNRFERYNLMEMQKFLNAIQDKKVTRYDLRKISGKPDSYIFKLQ